MQYTDVILVRPQEHDYDYLQWHEDIQLAYILSVLEKNGFSCRVFDFAIRPLLNANDYRKAIENIAIIGAPLIALVIDKHPTNSPYYACEFISELRSQTDLTNSHLTIYGNTQIGTHRLLSELPVDSVVTGEEMDFLALAKAVTKQATLENVPGVAFRTSSGVQINPPLPRLTDLDELPFPKRYYFDLPLEERNQYGYVGAMLASRGCYAKCTFCYIRAKETTHDGYLWLGRTPQNVVDEMEVLYRDHGTREFSFLDPQFFGPGVKGQKWGQAIAQEIINRELRDIAFTIYARANDIKAETISLLKQAGLYAVFIGIESFSQKVLDRYKKGLTVAENIQAVKTLMDFDVRLRMGFITFDHFTTIEELQESISYLKRLCDYKPHLITQPVFFQNIMSPLEDTPAGQEYENIGASTKEIGHRPGQLITVQQKRLSRNGAITTFLDPRVAFLSEATRILASEILQRTTKLEIRASSSLMANDSNIVIDGQTVSFPKVLSWFDNLTTFAIAQFKNLFLIVTNDNEQVDILNCISQAISKACKKYDLEHLGFMLPLERSTLDEVFD